MKKLLAALLTLLFILTACAALAGGASYTPGMTLYVNNPDPTDRLNLRTEPSRDAHSIGKYYSGVSVELLDAPQNGWAHVRIAPYEGYMDMAYLTPGLGENEVKFAMPCLVVSSAQGATLRSQPTPAAEALYTYGQGSQVFNVMGVLSNGWIHVHFYAGENGFLPADALTPQLTFDKTETAVPAGYSAYVNNPDPTDRLNLRAAPGANADSLGKYYNGVEVLVLGDAGNGYWHVQVNSTKTASYMDSAYLTTAHMDASLRPTAKVRNPNATLTNIRSAPSYTAEVLYTAENGEGMAVMGVTPDGWLHVQVEGIFGYIRSSLVTPEVFLCEKIS